MTDNKELEIDDIVNDTAGYPGNVVDVITDSLVKVKWEDGSMTLENVKELIKV